ncbi:hypothetical protein ABFA07_006390 [Porites harrisoni]
MALTERAEQISEFYSRVVDNSHNWNDGFLTFGEWKKKSGDPIPHPLCYEAVYDELLEGNMIQADHSVLDVAYVTNQIPEWLQHLRSVDYISPANVE